MSKEYESRLKKMLVNLYRIQAAAYSDLEFTQLINDLFPDGTKYATKDIVQFRERPQRHITPLAVKYLAALGFTFDIIPMTQAEKKNVQGRKALSGKQAVYGQDDLTKHLTSPKKLERHMAILQDAIEEGRPCYVNLMMHDCIVSVNMNRKQTRKLIELLIVFLEEHMEAVLEYKADGITAWSSE